ncbi:unnamed protein product, partial [Nesidiocoris tenuis]
MSKYFYEICPASCCCGRSVGKTNRSRFQMNIMDVLQSPGPALLGGHKCAEGHIRRQTNPAGHPLTDLLICICTPGRFHTRVGVESPSSATDAGAGPSSTLPYIRLQGYHRLATSLVFRCVHAGEIQFSHRRVHKKKIMCLHCRLTVTFSQRWISTLT